MTSFIGQYNIYKQINSVRLASSDNIAGLYFNGVLNDGIGAQLVCSSLPVTIDSNVVNIGDRIVLFGQTNTNENGIYDLISTNVLQRSADFNNASQLSLGQFFSAYSGLDNVAQMVVIVDPLPAVVGINTINFATAIAEDNIETGSFTATMAGAVPTNTYTIKWEKIENIVSLSFPAVSFTASSAAAITAGVLPAGIRPATTISYPIPVLVNTTIQVGKLVIPSGATSMMLYATQNNGNFTNSVAAGYGAAATTSGLTVVYNVAPV